MLLSCTHDPDARTLTLTVALAPTPVPSSTGKSLHVVRMAPQVACMLEGKPVKVQVSAYVPAK